MKNIISIATLLFMTICTYSQISNIEELKIEEGIDLVFEDAFTNNSSALMTNRGTISFNNDFNNQGELILTDNSITFMNQNFNSIGTIEVEINGELAGVDGGYSELEVADDLLLAGTINVTIDPAYLPSDGTAHTIITYGGVLSGTFDTENIISTSGWFVDYSTTGEVNVIRDSVLDIENVDTISFSVYPNPTSGIVSIQTKETIDKIEIFDINGRLIFNKSGTTQIDISNLSIGVYMLKVIDENGKSSVKKIIKN